MISVDTNLLLPAIESDNPNHLAAAAFLDSLQGRADVAISEFILLELYGLLRNPAVLAQPLGAAKAANVCEAFRNHPHWQLIGFPPESRAFHDHLWLKLRQDRLARRRAYDLWTAYSLLRHGVKEFATVNLKHFENLGFVRVWNPLLGGA